jgi:hypothetical protein
MYIKKEEKMKKIFFFLIITITILLAGQVLAEQRMTCNLEARTIELLAAECYEIKLTTYNTTRPIINVTFQEENVVVYGKELRRIGDLDYDLEDLNGDYFQSFHGHSTYELDNITTSKYQPTHILSDGTYVFKLNAFNEPNVYLDVSVFFKVNASQMNMWVLNPANHSIEKPDFAASSTRYNNLTIETEWPVNECKHAPGLRDGSAEFLFNDFLEESFTTITNTTVTIENFDFQYTRGRTANTTHNFKILEVICQEKPVENVPPRYSYKRIHVLLLETPPNIETTANPSTVINYRDPFSRLNITTHQTSTCYIELEPLPESVNGYNPTIPYDSNYIFDSLNYYKRNDIQKIEFRTLPSPHEFKFNLTCTNLANLSRTITQTIKTDFYETIDFVFTTPERYINSKTINVSGVFIDDTANCQVKFNEEETFHQLTFQRQVLQGTHAGTYLYQATITKPTFTDGEHTIHGRCTGMPEEMFGTTKFILDTKKPTNMTITTAANSCSLTEIRATLSAQDENGISHYEYKLEYKGKIAGNYDKEDTTSSSLRISIPSGLENETFDLRVRAIDRAGNEGDWVTRTIKITDSKIIECDTTPPQILRFITPLENKRQLYR